MWRWGGLPVSADVGGMGRVLVYRAYDPFEHRTIYFLCMELREIDRYGYDGSARVRRNYCCFNVSADFFRGINACGFFECFPADAEDSARVSSARRWVNGRRVLVYFVVLG